MVSEIMKQKVRFTVIPGTIFLNLDGIEQTLDLTVLLLTDKTILETVKKHVFQIDNHIQATIIISESEKQSVGTYIEIKINHTLEKNLYKRTKQFAKKLRTLLDERDYIVV